MEDNKLSKLKTLSEMSLLILLLGMAAAAEKHPRETALPETAAINSVQQSVTEEDNWEYISFSAAGLDPTRSELLKVHIQDGTFRKVDGLIVIKNGKVLIEEYFNGFSRNMLHEIRSATKSIGSALLGIAIDQGYISGVQEKLFSYFKEWEPFQHWDEHKDEITIKDVLNMTTGLDSDDMNTSSLGNETNLLEANDIIRFMLDLPVVYNPGEHWAYSTGTAHLAGAVIEQAAGISVQEFAKTHLFEPLNITQYKWKTEGGLAHTGGGFWMRPIDMAKIGQLYLDKGKWYGQQVIPEEWINDSSKIHIQVTTDFGYGYLWWKRTFYINERPFPAFVAQGNGENHIFVIPDLELVVVLTGSSYGDIYGPVQTAMMMNKYILPAVVQDINLHTGEPDLRNVPKLIFAVCAILLLTGFILWPADFIIRKIRRGQEKNPEIKRVKSAPVIVRIISSIAAFIILCLIAVICADTQFFELLLNTGMSHPLSIFEVFLGTDFIIIVTVVIWLVALLMLVQVGFTVLAYKNNWWTRWQRWHFTAMTVAVFCFVLVLFWWGFGKFSS